MKNIKLFFCLFAVVIALPACDTEEKPFDEGKSDKAVVTAVNFTISDNPGLQSASSGHSMGNIWYVSVLTSDLSSLKPSFTTVDGGIVMHDGKDVTDGSTAIDFTKIQKFTVVSESGKKSADFEVYVQSGNDKIDYKVYDFMRKYDIPGVSVSVMKGEEVIYSKGYGFAISGNGDGRVPATENTLYRIGSMSKQFTTLCIMTLYERGLLDIDDKVFGAGGILNEQFPGVTGPKATITIRNLLQHNSGFPTSPDPMFSSIRDGKSLDDLIRYVLEQNLENDPGSKYNYYNMGFGMLGRVVEVVSGKPYEQFLKEDVLAKMGIDDIHVGGALADRRPNEAVYYSQSGTDGYANPMKVIAAAGGIIASTEQLMKVLAHIDGAAGVPDIVKKETLDWMYNSPSPNYARYSLGWRIGHNLYPQGHYHAGNLAGTTAIWVGGSLGMSAALLCNSRSYLSDASGDFDDAYYILIGQIIDFFR